MNNNSWAKLFFFFSLSEMSYIQILYTFFFFVTAFQMTKVHLNGKRNLLVWCTLYISQHGEIVSHTAKASQNLDPDRVNMFNATKVNISMRKAPVWCWAIRQMTAKWCGKIKSCLPERKAWRLGHPHACRQNRIWWLTVRFHQKQTLH